LTAAYGFNEGSGTTAADVSGNNLPATISGRALDDRRQVRHYQYQDNPPPADGRKVSSSPTTTTKTDTSATASGLGRASAAA
jgi:hypothetical protein